MDYRRNECMITLLQKMMLARKNLAAVLHRADVSCICADFT